MINEFRLSNLIPCDLTVVSIAEGEDTMLVTAKADVWSRPCPRTGEKSSRVHSRYVRTVSDLLCLGRKVRVHLQARRFVCNATLCQIWSASNSSTLIMIKATFLRVPSAS